LTAEFPPPKGIELNRPLKAAPGHPSATLSSLVLHTTKSESCYHDHMVRAAMGENCAEGFTSIPKQRLRRANRNNPAARGGAEMFGRKKPTTRGLCGMKAFYAQRGTDKFVQAGCLPDRLGWTSPSPLLFRTPKIWLLAQDRTSSQVGSSKMRGPGTRKTWRA